MMKQIAPQLWSLLLQLALALALSFLDAVLLRDTWNWFLVPAAPGALAPLSYPAAYGIMVAVSAFAAVLTTPSTAGDPDQAEHPFAHPIAKALGKAVVVLAMWGIAAAAHAAIGG